MKITIEIMQNNAEKHLYNEIFTTNNLLQIFQKLSYKGLFDFNLINTNIFELVFSDKQIFNNFLQINNLPFLSDYLSIRTDGSLQLDTLKNQESNFLQIFDKIKNNLDLLVLIFPNYLIYKLFDKNNFNFSEKFYIIQIFKILNFYNIDLIQEEILKEYNKLQKTIFISNLDINFDEKYFIKKMSEFGKIEKYKFIKNLKTNKKNIFIEFKNINSAINSLVIDKTNISDYEISCLLSNSTIHSNNEILDKIFIEILDKEIKYGKNYNFGSLNYFLEKNK